MEESQDSMALFIVVLYNKAVVDSATIQSLANYKFEKSKIIVFNNGPMGVVLTDEDKAKLNNTFCSHELVNCIENKPLSMLYNDIINNNRNFNKFVILDDDSIITDSFSNIVNSSNFDLELPRIQSVIDDKTYYPINDKKIVLCNGILNPKTVVSIASGMIINNRLVDIFRQYNLQLFDDSFALYGVDASFFRRLNYIALKEDIKVNTSSIIIHSLSRIEKKEKIYSSHERIIDITLSTKKYPSVHLIYIFLLMLSKQIANLDFSSVMLVFKTFLGGEHERCKLWKNRVKSS
ncbi:glycosyl transferase [Klebsiella michiganensis]|uniref:glycosyl transferase n=1 Tax=Klebsiella michiganensis TaxID=1134687 RepID=UPI00244D3CB0|nr:glycosyl transferase [Klebsiella michiganensis]MDH0490918.1 glycosyl transferase [Klebsiella michiganensis]HBM3063887.1 glycosyl transferase [Klebsiella michiganensis]HDS6469107.1 glycosyl transferase [Klebsiella michiganensis]HDT0417462.1 glycosyl transferase [Klebsiella michiganensis]HDX9095229.1 glycosyl transferase [Klebsiella michiganensis]